MPCKHYWMVGEPIFTREGHRIVEHTEQDCVFCLDHKDNQITVVTLPPDVIECLNLPIEVLRGDETYVPPRAAYVHWKTGELTKARAT